jgi:hypothetical protein
VAAARRTPAQINRFNDMGNRLFVLPDPDDENTGIAVVEVSVGILSDTLAQCHGVSIKVSVPFAFDHGPPVGTMRERPVAHKRSGGPAPA